LINNHPATPDSFQQAVALAKSLFTNIEIINGHGNIGYGRANNLAIKHTQSDYHLILNPDVDLDSHSIFVGINYLEQHSEVGLAAPNAYQSNGEYDFLAKRRPSLLTVIIRGINSPTLNRLFKRKLDNYSYKDMLPSDRPVKIELASGCFMLCRTDILKRLNGFSPKYFLYFEDFDLSLKIGVSHELVQLPQMRIIHKGGNTAQKGMKHILLFLTSACQFLTSQHPNKKSP
jgi:GT2 family glycosyltransferase